MNLDLCDTYEEYVAQCEALAAKGFWISEYTRPEWEEAKRQEAASEKD